MLDNLIHHISDFFTFIWWFFSIIKELFLILIQPLVWIFNFGRGLFSTLFKTPEQLGIPQGEIVGFSQSVFDFFNVIPHFNYILIGVAGILWILFLSFFIKKINTI